MAEHRSSFDLIVSTVSAPQDLDLYSRLLKRDGTLVLVGAGPERHVAPAAGTLIGRRRSIAGSAIGGIAETQEMPPIPKGPAPPGSCRRSRPNLALHRPGGRWWRAR